MSIIHTEPTPAELACLTEAELLNIAKRPAEVQKQYEAALTSRRLALKELLGRNVTARSLAKSLGVTYQRIHQITAVKVRPSTPVHVLADVRVRGLAEPPLKGGSCCADPSE